MRRIWEESPENLRPDTTHVEIPKRCRHISWNDAKRIIRFVVACSREVQGLNQRFVEESLEIFPCDA